MKKTTPKNDLTPVMPKCPIHDRTLQKMTPLRERVLEVIEPLLLPNGPRRQKRTVHENGKTVKMLIRPLTWLDNENRRIFEVTMLVIRHIRGANGKLRRIVHNWTLECSISFKTIFVPA